MPDNYNWGSVEVDTSDLYEKLHNLQAIYKKSQIDTVLRRTFTETARHVRTIVGDDVPKEYVATKTWAKKGVQGWRSEGLGCVIPLEGTKLGIGKGGAKLYKSARGRGRPKKSEKGKVFAAIVRGKISEVPRSGKSQGGQPTWIWNGTAFARKYPGKRLPIARVVTLALPQMPMNRSRPDVKKDIEEYMMKRLEHHINRMVNGKA